MSARESPDALRAEWRWVLVGVVTVAALLLVQVAWGILREDEASRLELVQTCLRERSTPFEEVSGDPIAESAARGALRTAVEGNGVTVVLGDSEADAKRVYDAYAAVAPSDALPRIEQNRKVVFLWDTPPTPAQHDFMVLCTLDAQE